MSGRNRTDSDEQNTLEQRGEKTYGRPDTDHIEPGGHPAGRRGGRWRGLLHLRGLPVPDGQRSAPPDGARQERHDDRPGGHRPGDGGLRRRGAGDERGRGFPGGPQRARPHRRRQRHQTRKEQGRRRHERTRGADPRAGRGQGAAGVHLPAGRGDDGGVRPVLRRIPLRPRRAVRGEDGPGRPPGPGGAGRRRREDRRSAAAPGGRRPAEVPAWGEALRRAAVRAGAERAARAGAAGEERPRPPAADGEAGG